MADSGLEGGDEPKLTLRNVAATAVDAVGVFFSVCVPALGIVIVGLAADTIAWSSSATTVAKTIFERSTPDPWYM